MRRVTSNRRELTSVEKKLLAPYIATLDLERAIVHFGRVPWYLPRKFHAIARGNHIYFRAGTCDPDTPQGMALLAHELVHVSQYRAGMNAVSYLCSLFRGYHNSRYERAASATQARILRDFAAS